jgi:hypothetical protein
MPLTRRQRKRRNLRIKKAVARVEREKELTEYLSNSGWTKGREVWMKPDWEDKERKYSTSDGKPPEGIEPFTCYASLCGAAKIQRKLDSKGL